MPARAIASEYQLRERVAHGFLEHDLAADPLDDERRRDLAAAEAGQLQLAPELAGLALEAALDLVRRDLAPEAHARVAELGDGGLEGGGHDRHDTVPARMRRTPTPPAASRRAEAWLWTGPVGHLVGGALDFAGGARPLPLARARRRSQR